MEIWQLLTLNSSVSHLYPQCVHSITHSTGTSFCALWPTLLVGPHQCTAVMFVALWMFVRCCWCCPVCLLLLVAALCITTQAELEELLLEQPKFSCQLGMAEVIM